MTYNGVEVTEHEAGALASFRDGLTVLLYLLQQLTHNLHVCRVL